jgi:DNA-binding transcriptional ArsR family regulator
VKASAALSALSDPTRRSIFEKCAQRARGVGEIAAELPVSRPAVSQHLKVLKDARLVIAEKRGRAQIYHVDPDGLGALRAWLDRQWEQSLAAFKRLADEEDEA